MRAIRTLQVAVKRGHEKLMEYNPEYFKKINVDSLDIELCRHCVLGQIGGFAKTGREVLNQGLIGLSNVAWKYGFEGKSGFGKKHEEIILTDLWKRRIRKLKNEAAR